MIISLKNVDELGTALPMLSRAGQSTIPQHLCFSNAPENKREIEFTKKDEEEEQLDYSLLYGHQFRPDLNEEMKKLYEKAKKSVRPQNGTSSSQGNRTSSGFFVPYKDAIGTKFEEEKKPGDKKSACFKS